MGDIFETVFGYHSQEGSEYRHLTGRDRGGGHTAHRAQVGPRQQRDVHSATARDALNVYRETLVLFLGGPVWKL